MEEILTEATPRALIAPMAICTGTGEGVLAAVSGADTSGEHT